MVAKALVRASYDVMGWGLTTGVRRFFEGDDRSADSMDAS